MLSLIGIKEVFSGKSKCVFSFFFLVISFQSDFSSFYWLYFTAVLSLNWRKRGTNVPPSAAINVIWVHVPHICTCCHKHKGRAVIIRRNVALPSIKLALSWYWRNYSSLQQMKNKSVVNISFLRWCWYYFICTVWLIIYLLAYLLVLHSSIAHWTQRQVEWCILFCNPGFFMFRGHLILYFQLLCLHLLFFLPNLQHWLHCPTTSCEWKTEHSRGKKSRKATQASKTSRLWRDRL